MSGWDVWNNSFINCSTGTFVGGGSYNLIHDNYYEDVDTCQHFDARGKGHGPSCNASAQCVTTGNGGNCTCAEAAAYHNLHGPAGQEWTRRWGTEMQAVIDDPKCVNKQGALPCHTQVVNNTWCNCKKFIDASASSARSRNAVVANNKEVQCRNAIGSKTDDAVAAAPCRNASGDVWLSPSGDNTHSGCSLAQAVRTPLRAQQLLRQHRSQLLPRERAIMRTVWVQPGVYELAETLQLTELDSYTSWEACPAAAVAADGTTPTVPVFSAGRTVAGFEPCGVGCPTSASGVVMLNLSAAAGISTQRLGSLSPRGWPGVHAPAPMELFTPPAATAPGTPQLLAQYPNHDMLGIASVAGGDYRPWMNGSIAWVSAIHGGFTVRDNRPGQWKLNGTGQRGNAFWLHHAAAWKDGHCELGAVTAGANDTSMVLLSTDADAGSRCLADPSRFDKFDVSSPGGMSRFFFYNVLEELDTDGEYFVDKPTATLYWKPASPQPNLTAVVSMLPTVVSARNVTSVRFVGLAFLHARGDGIEVASSSGVEVLDSTIANVGELGVNITNSSASTVSGCSISQTGSGGVWLDGGDRDALISANLTLQRSNLTRVSRWERFPPGRGAGVTLHGVGHTVLDSSFVGIPHQSVRVYGNDHTIQNCTFTNSLWETADAGVIYSGRDWSILGNKILGNRIDGVHSLYYPRKPWMRSVYPEPDGRWGDYVKAIHLDDQVGGFLVAGNSFTNYSFGFDINGGGRHTIRGNQFGACPDGGCTTVIAQHAVGGKRPWTKANKVPCEPINPSVLPTIFGLGAVPWNSSLWRRRYPRFAQMIDDRTYCVPYNNEVIDNRYVGVPCIDYPVLMAGHGGKANAGGGNTPQQLRLWNFTSEGNSNTVLCNRSGRR